MKKLLFIMNPYAGTRKANRYLADIISIFNAAGYEVTSYMTAGPGDCKQIASRKASDSDILVCCGGDGTFNEAVSGLMESGVNIPIGYIPAGSTNDFATSLGISTDICKAARAIANGQPETYDLGLFGDRIFSYVASFGIFTRTSYATPQSLKNALGHTAYVLQGVQELAQLRTEHVRLELSDGTVLEDDYLFGAVCNSTSMGGVLTLDPKQVDMRDGKLELLLIRQPKDLAELTECIFALQKQSYNCSMMTFLSTTGVTVTAREDMAWTLDGELEPGRAHVEISCLQHAIRLIKEPTP